jgi:hypothetical protein
MLDKLKDPMFPWQKIEDARDGYEYITEMKHGIISGTFDAKEQQCDGYYWQSMSWFPDKVMEIDTPEKLAQALRIAVEALEKYKYIDDKSVKALQQIEDVLK